MGVFVKDKSYYISIEGNEDILAGMKSMFEDPSIEKITYEAKKRIT